MGEGGAAGGDGDQAPTFGGGVDGEGVHRTFDQHDVGSFSQCLDRAVVQAQRQCFLVEDRGVGGVEVLRVVGVGVGRGFAGHEAHDLPVGVVVGEGEAVAEEVVQSAL